MAQLNSTTSEETRQFLRFRVGAEIFALPISHVIQIIDKRPATRVPSVSQSIMGVFNYDGAITPLVDAATKFQLPAGTGKARGCIIVVSAHDGGASMPLGLLADSVVDVVQLRASEVEPRPQFGTRVRLEYLEGLARIGERFTLVLNVDRFLSAAELLDLAVIRETPLMTAEAARV